MILQRLSPVGLYTMERRSRFGKKIGVVDDG
jgi:hypothetical protein